MNEWNRVIYNELAEGRPVFYSGEAGGLNGHAFVIDRYAGNNYFRVNWGWSGAGNDGAYLLSILEPNASGTGAGNAKGGYNQLMRAVIGAKPATAGSPQNKESNIIVQNFKVDEGQLSANFVNGLDVEQKAELGFAYRKADGELQLVAATASTKMAPPRKLYYSPYTLKCPVTSLSDGTYKVVPVARTQPENKWQSVWSAENMPRRSSKADGWSAIPSSRRRPSNCRSWLPATSP